MTNTFQAMQRRFGNDRPGLRLLAVEDAALPVTMLRTDVLAQEKKKLPVTEEFVLRFVSVGVDAPEQIAAYLGLDAVHVLDAAAAQLSDGHLRRSTDQRLKLTAQGHEVVSNLVATQPVIQPLPVAFDRLTWTTASYVERSLVEKREAEEAGMTILPAARNASIGLPDVTPAGLNALLRDERLQVLRVHRVVARKHRYLPVQLLVYGEPEQNEIELAVCIDDELSPNHGLALERGGAIERLGLSVGAAEPRPILDAGLEELRTKDGISGEAPSEKNGVQSGIEPAGKILTSQVRSVSVYEHADLLTEALEKTKRHLLIISPWVRGAVVNGQFCRKLEQRLKLGVSVTIAHGIGSDDSGSDRWAIEKLQRLAVKYKNFSFVRLQNTHAKILIFDDNWVSTSFNWLSFRGDPSRTYRMEEGTLVTVTDRVMKEYERYLKMIDDQASGKL